MRAPVLRRLARLAALSGLLLIVFPAGDTWLWFLVGLVFAWLPK